MLPNNYLFFTEQGEIHDRVHYIVPDTLYDIRVVTVPVLPKAQLRLVIIKELQKEVTYEVNDRNIDYICIDRIGKKMNLLVFISQFNHPHNHSIFFTLYHYLHHLIKHDFFHKTVKILVEEESEFFLYVFRDGEFRKRYVYYEDDLDVINERHLYRLKLSDGVLSSPVVEGYLTIPDEVLKEGYNFRAKPVFKAGGTAITMSWDVVIIAALICVICGASIYFWQLRTRVNEKQKYLHTLELEAKELGRTSMQADRELTRYIALENKYPRLYSILTVIYEAGKDNLKINTMSVNGNKFTISGTCRDDASLESAFRSHSAFKTVNFTFTRSSKGISCVLAGVYSE